MSYRTYVNNTQIFGNNEYYPEWIEFIKEQGVEINDEGNYSGKITDFMGALEVIEKITLRMEADKKKRRIEFEEEMKEKNFSDEEKEFARSHVYGVKSIFDWTNLYDKVSNEKEEKFGMSLLDELISVINESYAFMPYQFFKACEEKLEQDKCFSSNNHFHCYKLKDGETIEVSAG